MFVNIAPLRERRQYKKERIDPAKLRAFVQKRHQGYLS